MVVRPVELDRLAPPQPVEDGETFVELLRPHHRIRILSDGFELARFVTQGRPKHHPPAGELVQGGDLASEIPRTAAGDRSHHGSDPHTGRTHRDRSESHPGIEDRHLLDEESVPADLLRFDGELHQQSRISKGSINRHVEAKPHGHRTYNQQAASRLTIREWYG